jgi:hypothetical protein
MTKTTAGSDSEHKKNRKSAFNSVTARTTVI